MSPQVLEDESARRVVAGVALHWYADSASLPSSLDHVHDTFPDKFLLYTEACNGERKLHTSQKRSPYLLLMDGGGKSFQGGGIVKSAQFFFLILQEKRERLSGLKYFKDGRR